MDKRRQDLEDLQDDIHLALLMDEYAENMGKAIRMEAEHAFESGEIAIPPEVDAACRTLLKDVPKAERIRTPVRAIMRYALVAVATIILLFGTLVGVQAAGIDVFGSIASWTDSVFHYRSNEETTRETEQVEQYSLIHAALFNAGMPRELAPLKLPDGYEITEIKVTENEYLKTVGVIAKKAVGNTVQFYVEEDFESVYSDDPQWEKNDPSAQIYTSNGRTFYCLENDQRWSAVWSDGRFSVSFFGFETREELIATIKTIGE